MKYQHGGNVHKATREKGVKLNEIIDFSANINPFGLSKYGEEAVIKNISGVLNYPDPDYYNLKLALSEYNNTDFNKIFLGNGAIDGLFFLVGFLKSKKAMVIAPSFVEYERSLNFTGTNVYYHYLDKKNNFQLKVDDLIEELKETKSDLLIFCNPNNPTGNIIEFSEVEKIVDFCNDSGIRIIIDEAFMDFADFNEKNSAISMTEKFHNLFILRSLTKFFAIPGLRMGYVISSNKEFSKYYYENKEPWMINYLAEVYSIESIKDYDYILNTKRYICSERTDFVSSLNMIKGIKAYKSFGNFVFFQYFGEKDIKGILYERNILIRDCGNYEGLSLGYFRVAVKDRANNSILIKNLKEICED